MVKVLVVEDEASIREMIALNLRLAGMEAVEADSAEAALPLLEQRPGCDAAILDVMLPGMNGFSLCETIRRTDQKIGIIILSAKGQEQDKIRGLSIGADDYMTKPFSVSELLARVEALCRRVGRSAGNDAGVVEEQLHDLELHLSQLNGLACLEQHAAVLVQHKFAAGEHPQRVFLFFFVPACSTADAAAQRFHTGQQFAYAERLGHIVIGTNRKAADLVLLLSLGAEDDNTDLLIGAADGLAQGEAVHARQHHIQNGRIAARLLLQQRQSRLGAFGLHSLHARKAQVQRDHLADVGFIFNDKHSYHELFLRSLVEQIQRLGQAVIFITDLHIRGKLRLHLAGCHDAKAGPALQA